MTTPPRPDQTTDPPGAVVAPGSQTGVFRGRLIIVSGGGPPGSGVYVYSPSVALGDLIASLALAGTDTKGNAVLSGVASYFGPGSGTFGPQWFAVTLQGGQLKFFTATGPAGPWNFTGTFMTGGSLSLAETEIWLVPSGDTSGATDTAAIVGSLLTANSLHLTPGAWYLTAGSVVMGPGQWLSAPGATIHCVGAAAGDFIRMVSTSTVSSLPGGGIIGHPVIDGSGAAAGSAGIHAGDMFQLTFDAVVQNFTGAGSINWWFDNQYTFTEQITGKIYSGNGTQGVVFDNSTGTSLSAAATGSFDRFAAQIFLTGMVGNAVTLQNGAIIVDPVAPAGIYGNMVTGAASMTACLTITGSNAGGFSLIKGGQFSTGVELRNAGGTVPMTISFGTRTSNQITDCSGIMDFSGNFAFTASNNYTGVGIGSFRYDGPVYGDANLTRSQALGRQPFNQAPISTGGTITTKYTGLTRITTSGGADVTGIILQGFNPDDWREITVMNVGTTGTITFAAPATSRVADGTSDFIPAGSSATYHWSPDETMWFRVSSGASDWIAMGAPIAGWTVGVAQYRPVGNGTVLVQITNLAPPGAPPVDGTTIFTAANGLQPPFRPAAAQRMICYGSAAIGTETPALEFETGGQINVYGVGGTTIGRIDGTFTISTV